MHTLCASIASLQALSSPKLSMHSSRSFLVSGHAQHGFNLGFSSTFDAATLSFVVAVVAAVVVVDDMIDSKNFFQISQT
jgi:hypothetical protein